MIIFIASGNSPGAWRARVDGCLQALLALAANRKTYQLYQNLKGGA
jgi:hypothetical protein